MTILQINKFFYPKGGADQHYFDLIKLLSKEGNNVIPFSMKLHKGEELRIKDPQLRTLYDKYRDYFVDSVEFGRNKTLKDFFKLGRMFWSKNAARKIKELLNYELKITDKLKIIAHIHNIYHQISPSILPVLKKYKIPVIMTVHDLHLISPIYAENIFEKLLCSAELFLHNKIFKINKYIDLFIAPSKFVKNELIRFGVKEDKIKVLPHFIEQEVRSWKLGVGSNGNYILYFGRLAPEKGVDILIKAYLKSGVDAPLYIAGDGPVKNELRIKYQVSSIKYLGNLDEKRLNEVIANSLFTVIPSRAPETFGMAALESYEFKKTVIASKIGALPEIVKDNETGLLFAPGDADDLAEKIKTLTQNKNLRTRLGENGHNFLKSFSPENYLRNLISIYN